MNGVRRFMRGAAGDLLWYLPEGARAAVMGMGAPEREPDSGDAVGRRLLWVLDRPPRRRRPARRPAKAPACLSAHASALPIAEGTLDALLLVGPLRSGAPVTPDDLRPALRVVRDRGRLVVAEPSPRGPMRRLLLRAWESATAPAPEALTALLLHAGLQDVRQEEIERSAWGRWFVTWGTVRKL